MAKSKKYRLTKKADQLKVNNQSALILEVLQRDFEVTTSYIAKEIAPVLKTRQTPERVVAFYISTWKKMGYVETILEELTETPVVTEKSKSTEPPPAIANVASAESFVTPAERSEGEDAEARKQRYLSFDLTQPISHADAVLFALAKLNEESNASEVHDFLIEVMGWEDIKADEVGMTLRFLLDEGLVSRDGVGCYLLV